MSLRKTLGACALPLFLLTQSVGEERQQPEKKGATPAEDRVPLALNLTKGGQYSFLATAGGPEKTPGEARPISNRYKLEVQEVSREGDIKVTFSIDEGKPAIPGAEPAATAAPKVIKATLRADGRVRRDSLVGTVPPELEQHFQLMLACGLHAEAMKIGQEVEMAPFFADSAEKSPAAGSELRLRLDGTRTVGATKLASFTVLAKGEPGEKLEKDPAGRGWRNVGEATYRIEDGLLERVQISAPLGNESPLEKPLRKLSIHRVAASAP